MIIVLGYGISYLQSDNEIVMAYGNSFRVCLKIIPAICTPRQIVVIFKKIEYSDNNKMNSVKTKKTDNRMLNLENQRKI